MLSKIGRTLQAYYLLSLFSLIFGIGIIIFYYWSSGLSNGHGISVTHRASIWLEQLEENSYLKKIENQVKEGEVKIAHNALQQLQKKVSDINRVQPLEDSYKAVELDLKYTYQSVNELLLLSDVSKIFQSLMQKILKFEKFVIDNNWKTLSQITSRMLIKLNNLGDYSIEKIEKLNKDISSDINSMKYITRSSRISKTDKKIIYERLRLLDSEILNLGEYANGLKSFFNHSEKLKSSYVKWSKEITPLISSKKLEIVEKTNTFGIFLLIYLGVASFFVLMSAFVFNKNSKMTKSQIEDYNLDIIKNKLLATSLTFNGESNSFQEELKKNHRYIHRYMSLGSIFNKTLPFGSALLDSNLNIAWANQEFYQSWNISEKKKSEGVIEWKYIHRLTNLGDLDPVLDGIQNLIGGVYQIKNKAVKLDSPQPFEMHVVPIEHSSQRWVMLFLYPLDSLHEAITEQSKSIIKPVRSSFKLLMQSDFSNDSWKNLRQDFFEAGTEELFTDFQDCWRVLREDRKSCLNEISHMERHLGSYQKTFKKISALGTDIKVIQEKNQSCILELKKDIISLSDNSGTEHVNEDNVISSAQSLVKNYKKIISVADDFEKNIDRGLKACFGLRKIQIVFSNLIKSFEEHHCKIHESINHILILNRTNKSNDLEKGILNLKSEARIFDDIFKQFLKSSRTLEIIVSKMNIVVDKDLLESGSEKLACERLNFETSLREFEALISNHKIISSKMAGFEENLVSDLRDMYEAIVQVGTIRTRLIDILDEDKKISHGKEKFSDRLAV